MKNPIITEMNNFVDFKAITAFSIKEATEKTIAEARKKLETIYSIENNTFQNTVEELDNIENDLNTVSSVIYLMAYTHVEEDVRKEAQNAINEFDKLGNEIILDEKLYEAFKKFATTQEAANLKDDKKKYFTETLKEFERNGLGLEADKKEELKKWKDELSEKSMQFSTNINDYQDFILISESETEGLPEEPKNCSPEYTKCSIFQLYYWGLPVSQFLQKFLLVLYFPVCYRWFQTCRRGNCTARHECRRSRFVL